jgi:hypothetical protein
MIMSVCIGIDMSKATLNIATDCGSHHIQVLNTPDGNECLLNWLQAQGDIHQSRLKPAGVMVSQLPVPRATRLCCQLPKS